MPINNFPASIQNVIEQVGYLERLFRNKLEAETIYRRLAMREPVEARIGETITKTRPALLPPVTADQNPSSNTGLDNGLSVQQQGFEQFQVSVGLFGNTMDLNLEQEETLIAPLYQEQWDVLAEQAARSLDTRMAMEIHQAYGGGNSFAIAANGSSSTSLKVDNLYGFRQAFPGGSLAPSAGLLQAVSSSNKLAIKVVASNGTAQTANVTAFTPDSTNVSTALVNGVAYGISGTLTLDSGVTCAIGDQVVAVDGAYVVRPNNKTTRFALMSTDVVTLQLFVQAAAKLEARRVPKIKGRYIAVVDTFMMAQLFNDPQFVRATQGQWGASVFKDGVIAGAVGIEFIKSPLVPIYSLPNAAATAAGLSARRAIVMGQGALVDAPFQGALNAAKRADAGFSISDIRIVDDIIMLTRPALDRMGQVISQTWKWTGGRSVPTDSLSTPIVIPSTDYSRYKRAVEVEIVG